MRTNKVMSYQWWPSNFETEQSWRPLSHIIAFFCLYVSVSLWCQLSRKGVHVHLADYLLHAALSDTLRSVVGHGKETIIHVKQCRIDDEQRDDSRRSGLPTVRESGMTEFMVSILSSKASPEDDL